MEESRKKANQKWLKANYESITIRVPKGTREQIKVWADDCGLSMASYIQEACKEKAAGIRNELKKDSSK
jgi:predicted DNA binding CopG/RHH family protein